MINVEPFGSTQQLANLIQRSESVAFYTALRPLAGRPANEIAKSSLAKHMPSETLSEWSAATTFLDPNTLNHHAIGDGPGYVAMVDMDYVLDRVKCPVLLISGDLACGGVIPAEDVDYALNGLANAQHVRLLDTILGCQQQNPNSFFR